MRVLVAPVLVGDRICRIVSPIESLLEVEEWVGEWWEPSSVTITTASQSPPASERVLQERGVPPEDHRSSEPATSDPEIQSLLRAHEPAAPHAVTLDPADGGRAAGRRRREYPGNARFRRGRPTAPAALDRAELRRADEPDRRGLRRRASDRPAVDDQLGPEHRTH